MSSGGLATVRTPSKWTVSFFVNLRATKRSYGALDYHASNLELLRGSSDLWEIVRCIRAVPPLTKLQNGSVSLFREGIRNIWEDPENFGGYILKMTLATTRDAALQHCKAHRRLCPVIAAEDLGDLWEFLVLAAVSGALDGHSQPGNSAAPSQALTTESMAGMALSPPSLNGIYCKAADGIVTLEFWFRSREGLDTGQTALRAAIGELGVSTSFPRAEVSNYKFLDEFPDGDVRVTLGDTIRITSMQTGITRGKSAARDGGEDLWGRLPRSSGPPDPSRATHPPRPPRPPRRPRRQPGMPLPRRRGRNDRIGQDECETCKGTPTPERGDPTPVESEADTLSSTATVSNTTETPSLCSETVQPFWRSRPDEEGEIGGVRELWGPQRHDELCWPEKGGRGGREAQGLAQKADACLPST